jgi:broad specificity phosphatase PhoE
MTTILLIRHGETDANRDRIYQGQVGAGLNAAGREQARLLADRLLAADVRPEFLYTSDLHRATETAAILGDRLGLVPIPLQGLREIFLGAWQGLSYREVAAQFPDEHRAWSAGEDVRRGGGENYADLQARMSMTMDRLAADHPHATLAVVSHGAAIKLFIAGILGIGFDKLPFFHVVSNTGISVVQRDGDRPWDLLLWNDARHLPHDPLAHLFLEDA